MKKIYLFLMAMAISISFNAFADLDPPWDEYCHGNPPTESPEQTCVNLWAGVGQSLQHPAFDFDVQLLNATTGEARCVLFNISANDGLVYEHRYTLGNLQPCVSPEWCYRGVHRTSITACLEITDVWENNGEGIWRVVYANGVPPALGHCHFLSTDINGNVSARTEEMQGGACIDDFPGMSCKMLTNNVSQFRLQEGRLVPNGGVFQFTDEAGNDRNWHVQRSGPTTRIWEETAENLWQEIAPDYYDEKNAQRLEALQTLNEVLDAEARTADSADQGQAGFGGADLFTDDELAEQAAKKVSSRVSESTWDGEGETPAIKKLRRMLTENPDNPGIQRLRSMLPESKESRANQNGSGSNCTNGQFNELRTIMRQRCRILTGCGINDDKTFCGAELERISDCTSAAWNIVHICGQNNNHGAQAVSVITAATTLEANCRLCYENSGNGDDDGSGFCPL